MRSEAGTLGRIGLTFVIIGALLFSVPLAAAPPGGGGKPPATPADPAIAFVTGFGDVAVMNADGSNRVTVLSGTAVNDISWSPDATQVALARVFSDSRNGIYVLDIGVVNGVPQGSSLRQVVSCNCWFVAWSPLGSELAYTRTGAVPRTVEVVSSAGGTPTVLYDGGGGTLQHVTWSSDGTRIAFIEQDAVTFERSIKILERSTGTVTHTLLKGQYYLSGLDWARQGLDTLAFKNGGELPDRIYTVEIGSGTVTPVVASLYCGYPSWSPDNTKLVYCVRTSNGNGPSNGNVQYLQTVSLSTGQTQTLTSTKNGWAWAPDWRRF